MIWYRRGQSDWSLLQPGAVPWHGAQADRENMIRRPGTRLALVAAGSAFPWSQPGELPGDSVCSTGTGTLTSGTGLASPAQGADLIPEG